MNILTLHCWSHFIKFHLFSWSDHAFLATGTVERVGLDGSSLSQQVPGREPIRVEVEYNDHHSAVALIVATLSDPHNGVIAGAESIAAVGHRVAHGGDEFRHSVRIDDQVLESLRSFRELAPQHITPNLSGIEAALAQLPGSTHVAIFDTAFHLSLPDYATIYPLPYEWYEKYRVRRYGFHGPSHLYLSRRAAVLLGKPAGNCNLITIHIDRGISLCAIKNGRSIDTSMGMTPLEGAIMNTRSGDIDAGIYAFMIHTMELSAREMDQILNYKSGILGITGSARERADFIHEAMAGDARCRTALTMQTYRIKKYIGAYAAIIGPVDGIVFTTGAAETEWLVREMVLEEMACFGIHLDREKNRRIRAQQEEVEITGEGSRIRTFVIPTNEELVLAEDAAAIHVGSYSDHAGYDYSFAQRTFVPYG